MTALSAYVTRRDELQVAAAINRYRTPKMERAVADEKLPIPMIVAIQPMHMFCM